MLRREEVQQQRPRDTPIALAGERRPALRRLQLLFNDAMAAEGEGDEGPCWACWASVTQGYQGPSSRHLSGDVAQVGANTGTQHLFPT